VSLEQLFGLSECALGKVRCRYLLLAADFHGQPPLGVGVTAESHYGREQSLPHSAVGQSVNLHQEAIGKYGKDSEGEKLRNLERGVDVDHAERIRHSRLDPSITEVIQKLDILRSSAPGLGIMGPSPPISTGVGELTKIQGDGGKGPCGEFTTGANTEKKKQRAPSHQNLGLRPGHSPSEGELLWKIGPLRIDSAGHDKFLAGYAVGVVHDGGP
jgi:hypothetical protein